MAKPKTKNTIKRVKIKKKYPILKLFIRAENNNSIITLTDLDGKVLAWSSAGKVGFKGTKKSTPFAAQKATEEMLERAKAYEASSLHLIIWGMGSGRDAFLRTIQGADFQIESIDDVTGFPFGGVKAKNKRRV